MQFAIYLQEIPQFRSNTNLLSTDKPKLSHKKSRSFCDDTLKKINEENSLNKKPLQIFQFAPDAEITTEQNDTGRSCMIEGREEDEDIKSSPIKFRNSTECPNIIITPCELDTEAINKPKKKLLFADFNEKQLQIRKEITKRMMLAERLKEDSMDKYPLTVCKKTYSKSKFFVRKQRLCNCRNQ